MPLVRLFHQIISFLLEINMLLALGIWGFQGEKSTVEKWLLGLGTPLLAAVLWGIWAAPKSAYRLALPYRLLFSLALYRLALPYRLLFSLALFGLAAFLLYRIGHLALAIVLAVVAIVSVLLEWLFEQ